VLYHAVLAAAGGEQSFWSRAACAAAEEGQHSSTQSSLSSAGAQDSNPRAAATGDVEEGEVDGTGKGKGEIGSARCREILQIDANSSCGKEEGESSIIS